MRESDSDSGRDELVDLLLDLQHDLGKYIRMPVAYLPKDASTDTLRAALEQALFRTRGEVSARKLWQDFVDATGERLGELPGYSRLAQTVERALAWEKELDSDLLDRERIEADLSAISPAIRALIGEIIDDD